MKKILVLLVAVTMLFVPIMAQAFTTAGEVAVKSSGVADSYWATRDEMNSLKRDVKHDLRVVATAASVKDLETKVASIETSVASRIQADRLVTDDALSVISGEVAATKGFAIEARDYSKNASEGVTSLSSQVSRSFWANIVCYSLLVIVVLAGFGAARYLIRRDLRAAAAQGGGQLPPVVPPGAANQVLATISVTTANGNATITI